MSVDFCTVSPRALEPTHTSVAWGCGTFGAAEPNPSVAPSALEDAPAGNVYVDDFGVTPSHVSVSDTVTEVHRVCRSAVSVS